MRPLPAGRPPRAVDSQRPASRDWKVPGNPPGPAVKQREKRTGRQQPSRRAKCRVLRTRGGGAAREAAERLQRRRQLRARSTPPAGPASQRAPSPGVHGLPPPPGPDPRLRCSPAVTWTRDFERGSGGPERCCGTTQWLNNLFLWLCI